MLAEMVGSSKIVRKFRLSPIEPERGAAYTPSNPPGGRASSGTNSSVSGVRVARGCSEGVPLAVKSNAAKEAVAAAPFVDLIACERECRTCSYAASLDCDGNCGICPHNGYCPCVNPVVARSKTALKIIELRPILLQDLQARN
jgi:hypothetical protein